MSEINDDDDDEDDILLAVSDAVDRPGLRGVELVEKLQTSISRCLQAAVAASHSNDPSTFAKLLIKVSDLRTLNTIHSEKLLGITVVAVRDVIKFEFEFDIVRTTFSTYSKFD